MILLFKREKVVPKTVYILNEQSIKSLCEQKAWSLLSSAIMDISFPNNFMNGTFAQPYKNSAIKEDTPDFSPCIHLIEKLQQLCQNDTDAGKFIEFLTETNRWLNAKQAVVNIVESKISAISNNAEIAKLVKEKKKNLTDSKQPNLLELTETYNDLNTKLNTILFTLASTIVLAFVCTACMCIVTSPLALTLLIAFSLGGLMLELTLSNQYEIINNGANEVLLQKDARRKEIASIEKSCEVLNQKIDDNNCVIKQATMLEQQCHNHKLNMKNAYLALNPSTSDNSINKSGSPSVKDFSLLTTSSTPASKVYESAVYCSPSL